MLPTIANITVTVPTQPTLVATPLPNSTATVRVAYDAVAPSVPDPTVNNNQRGGGNVSAPKAEAPIANTASPLLSIPIPASFSTSSASLSASAVFAAQSLAQDSASAPKILQAYEELVAMSEVKYKPSNAGVPQSQPSDVFSKALQQEQAAPKQIQIIVEQAARAKPEIAAQQASVASVNTPPAPTRANKSSNETARSAKPTADISLQTLSAYRNTQSRNLSLSEAPVEAVDKVGN